MTTLSFPSSLIGNPLMHSKPVIPACSWMTDGERNTFFCKIVGRYERYLLSGFLAPPGKKIADLVKRETWKK